MSHARTAAVVEPTVSVASLTEIQFMYDEQLSRSSSICALPRFEARFRTLLSYARASLDVSAAMRTLRTARPGTILFEGPTTQAQHHPRPAAGV